MKYIKNFENIDNEIHCLFATDDYMGLYQYLLNINAEPRMCKKPGFLHTLPDKDNIIYYKYKNDLNPNRKTVIQSLVNRSFILNKSQVKELIFDVKTENEIDTYLKAKKFNL